MITIKDIAKEANVTPTTVSNVINGNHSKVSQKTIKKIQSIIDKHNYIPNLTARSLVNNASKIIGLIIPEHIYDPNNFLPNPFHSELLCGIEHTIQKNGYYLMIRSITSIKDIQALLQTWNVDGVIILAINPDYYPKLINISQIPMIFIDSYIDDSRVLNVGLEDKKGSYLATSHLLEKGHTKIGFISYEINHSGVVFERFKGYQQALQDQGVPFVEDYVFEIDSSIHSHCNFHKLQSKLQEITAFFCTADWLAVELMDYLQSKKINIPDDISIIGFDDLYLARMVTPKLTTIRQNIIEKGIKATELVIQSIQQNEIKNRHIVLPVRLVERDSVKELK